MDHIHIIISLDLDPYLPELIQLIVTCIVLAEIVSDRYVSSNGYYLDKPPELLGHTEYTHNSFVDGDTNYGYAWGCFPRRCMVGYTYTDNNQYPGSRGMITNASTAYTHGGNSIWWQRLLIIIQVDIGY